MEDQAHHLTWYSSETTRIYEGSTLKNGQFYKKEQYFAIFGQSLAQFTPDTFVWCLCQWLEDCDDTDQISHWWKLFWIKTAFSFCFFLGQTYDSQMLMTAECQVLRSMMRSQRHFVYFVCMVIIMHRTHSNVFPNSLKSLKKHYCILIYL